MRAFLLTVAGVVIAIGVGIGALAAASDTSLVNLATIQSALDTIGQYPEVQVSVGLSSPHQSAAQFSYTLEESSDDPGVPVDRAPAANAAVFVFLNHRDALELYAIGERHLYARVDFPALASLAPGSAQSQLGQLQARYGDRWYALPALLRPRVESAAAQRAAHDFVASLGGALRQDAQLQVVGGPHGYEGVQVSGSTGQLLRSLLPAFGRVEQALGAPLSTPSLPRTGFGKYQATFYVDSSNVLREVTMKLASQPPMGLGVVIDHRVLTIRPPARAEPLPASVLASLGGLLRLAASGQPGVTAYGPVGRSAHLG
jgi:hypothetical protein